MIRAFAALRLPDEIADALGALQTGAPGRHVDEDNFHITLAFLGDVQGPVLDDVHVAFTALKAPAPHWSVDGFDVFGGARPRALFAQVKCLGALSPLQAKVAQAARDAGVPIERRRFTPHVTLSRLSGKGMEAEALDKFLNAVPPPRFGPIVSTDFSLFRSTLTRGGPVYDELARYPLADTDAS